ncbi:mynd finger protein [Cystoisospora suis]|uniref:Mynd finger protein n=1 Tax=Cystoisospora suis TaxID=483139 RepID=A0A2C6KFE6_9APIC|nr:mynd finger protein [Cystoisospora suis]
MEKERGKAEGEVSSPVEGQLWEEMSLQQVASFFAGLEKEAFDRQRRCRKVDSHDLLLQFLHYVAGPGGGVEASGDVSSSRQERDKDHKKNDLRVDKGGGARKGADEPRETEMREETREEQKLSKQDNGDNDVVWRAGWTRLLHESIVKPSQEAPYSQSTSPTCLLPSSSSSLSASQYRLIGDAGAMIATQHQQLCLSLLLFRDESWVRSSLEAIAESRLLLPDDLLSLLPQTSVSGGEVPNTTSPSKAAHTDFKPSRDALIPSDQLRSSQSQGSPQRLRASSRSETLPHASSATRAGQEPSSSSSSSPSSKNAKSGEEASSFSSSLAHSMPTLPSQSSSGSPVSGKTEEKSSSSSSCSETVSLKQLQRRKKGEKKDKKKDQLPKQKPLLLPFSEKTSSGQSGDVVEGDDDLASRVEQNCFFLMDEYFLHNFGIPPADVSSPPSASSSSSPPLTPTAAASSSSSSRSSSVLFNGRNKEKRFFRSLAHLYFLSSLCSSEFCVPIARHICHDPSFLRSLPSILLLSLKRGGFIAATTARALLHLAATGCNGMQKKQRKNEVGKRSGLRRSIDRENGAAKETGENEEEKETDDTTKPTHCRGKGVLHGDMQPPEGRRKDLETEAILASEASARNGPSTDSKEQSKEEGLLNDGTHLNKEREEGKEEDHQRKGSEKKARSKNIHQKRSTSPTIHLSTGRNVNWHEDDEVSTEPSSRDDLFLEGNVKVDSFSDTPGSKTQESAISPHRMMNERHKKNKEEKDGSIETDQCPKLIHPPQRRKKDPQPSSSSEGREENIAVHTENDSLSPNGEDEVNEGSEEEVESEDLLSLYSHTIITLLHLCLKEQAIDPRGINALSFFFLAPAMPLLLQTGKLREKLFQGDHHQRHSYLINWYLEVFLKALTDPQFRLLAANNLQLARYVSEVVLELASSEEGCHLLQAQKLRWFVMWRACKDLWKNDWNKGEHEAWELVLNKSIRGGKPVLHTEIAKICMWGTRASEGGCAHCMKSENTLRFLRLFTSPYAEDLSSLSSSETCTGEKADLTSNTGELKDDEKKSLLEEIFSHSPYRSQTPPHTQRARRELERRRRVAAQKKKEEEELERRRTLDEEEENRRDRVRQEEQEKREEIKAKQQKERNLDFTHRLEYIARVYSGKHGVFFWPSSQRKEEESGKSSLGGGRHGCKEKDDKERSPREREKEDYLLLETTGEGKDTGVDSHRKASYVCSMALSGYIFPWLVRAFEMHAFQANKDQVDEGSTSALLKDLALHIQTDDGNQSASLGQSAKMKEGKQEDRRSFDANIRGQKPQHEKAENKENREETKEREVDEPKETQLFAGGVASQDTYSQNDGVVESRVSVSSEKTAAEVFKIIITQASQHEEQQNGAASAKEGNTEAEKRGIGFQHNEDAKERPAEEKGKADEKDVTVGASTETKEKEERESSTVILHPTTNESTDRESSEDKSLKKTESVGCAQGRSAVPEEEKHVSGDSRQDCERSSPPHGKKETFQHKEVGGSEMVTGLKRDQRKQKSDGNKKSEATKDEQEEKDFKCDHSLERVISCERHLPLFPCPGCGLVEYCSEACRINDLPLHLFLCTAATQKNI